MNMTKTFSAHPTANLVFFRTYSRRKEGTTNDRESWDEVCDRTLRGLVELGKLTDDEAKLVDRMQRQLKSLPSGRWLWVGGTRWIENPENFSGSFNCTSSKVIDWRSFRLIMELAMMGSGTGAMLEPKYIDQLPAIVNTLEVEVIRDMGIVPKGDRQDETTIAAMDDGSFLVTVGDSRNGWSRSYEFLLEISSDSSIGGNARIKVDLGNVRLAGELLKGFGGVANPARLPQLYGRCAKILNKAIGRKLSAIECCLLIDEAAAVVVAGNVRRSAGLRQFDSSDAVAANAKDNLWQQDEEGNWRIDPDRDVLRMANHTRVFHHKPTLEECRESVAKQYRSGEGAIQWAGEAIARSNVDLMPIIELKRSFLESYEVGMGAQWMRDMYPSIPDSEIEHRLGRYGLNPLSLAA